MFASLLWPCGAPRRSCGCEQDDSSCSAASLCTQPHDSPPLVSESQVLVIPRTLNDPRRLTVPSVFTRFQFNVVHAQWAEAQGTLMDQQRKMLRGILRHFAKELTVGVVLAVVDTDGRSLEYVCRLDRKMTQIMMFGEDSAKVSKVLILKDIERICSPEEVRNLRTTNPVFIDESCTTLVFSENKFVTFRLESVAAREYLMLCLQVLRMSQDQARMWYVSSSSSSNSSSSSS